MAGKNMGVSMEDTPACAGTDLDIRRGFGVKETRAVREAELQEELDTSTWRGRKSGLVWGSVAARGGQEQVSA